MRIDLPAYPVASYVRNGMNFYLITYLFFVIFRSFSNLSNFSNFVSVDGNIGCDWGLVSALED